MMFCRGAWKLVDGCSNPKARPILQKRRPGSRRTTCFDVTASRSGSAEVPRHGAEVPRECTSERSGSLCSELVMVSAVVFSLPNKTDCLLLAYEAERDGNQDARQDYFP